MLAVYIAAAGSALAHTGLAAGRAVPAGADILLAGWTDAALLGLVAAAVIGAGVLAYRAWADARYGPSDDPEEPPPLVFPAMSQVAGVARPGARSPAKQATGLAAVPAAQSAVTAGVATRAPQRASPGVATGAATGAPQPKPRTQPQPRTQPPPQSRPRSTAGDARAPSRANGLPAPAEEAIGDATLQLLPGRLEVVSGDAGLEEIRFIRSGSGESVITLGRGSGSPPTHVQLRSPAVSRQHARLRFRDGAWYVSNLSQTNPAVVNGEVLADQGAERALSDGDQLELGDVVLRYRR